MGERLRFYLSLGLFSSFNVDSGTGMLLKTLAQRKIIPESGHLLDAGCGTGVIALSLKKRFPDLDVTASDRNALALRFTEKNAALNKIADEKFRTASGLLPGSLKGPVEGTPVKYDLIVSNIPAKAGGPVIRDFLQNCGAHLTADGIAAVVIVAPLARFAEESLAESGAEILCKEEDKQYSVFHFNPEKNTGIKSFSDVYERTANKISGFYGLPEFDSISYRTKTTLEMIKNFGCRGRVLIWNPGTGHIPAACTAAKEIIIAGPDLLQLKASDFNVTAGYPYHHLPVFSSLPDTITEKVDCIIAAPDFISGAEVETEVLDTSLRLLEKRGRLLISGRSSDIAKIEKIKNGYILKDSTKYRGFRSMLLEKL